MKRLSSFACVALPGLGTIAALQTGRPHEPFRRGAQCCGPGDQWRLSGRLVSRSVGRRAQEADRAAFAAGYQQGYASFTVDRALSRSLSNSRQSF